MKTCFLFIFIFITSMGFAQKGEIIKTEDGRRIFLKSDYTWEYIDSEYSADYTRAQELLKPIDKNACKLEDDYKEPKLDSKIQSQLKRGRSSMRYVKKKVAKDQNCSVDDVFLLSFSEQKKKAVYHFCANGTEVIYKRLGNSIIKASKLF